MATDPDEEFDRAKRRVETANITDEERTAIQDYLRAKHPDSVMHDGTLEKQTLVTYGDNIRLTAKRTDTQLLEMATDDVNRHMDERAQQVSKSTVQLYQCALVSFYRYHDGHDVDPDEIVIVQDEDSTVDERDMWTREEIADMRDVIPNDRDRAIFELLLNTGQRVRVLQTLRVKDVKPDEGVFYLNDDVDGLKGADQESRKRPLLGSRSACLDWLQKHPKSDDPEAAFITHLPTQEKRYGDQFGEPLSDEHIRRRLRKIGTKADIDKPVNPHNFRHNFVTIAKRDYDLDDGTIKFLIGHSEDSTVMETTYSHLSADDHISKAEIGAGIKEPSEESTLTPDICPTCYANLEPDAKACSQCGEIFTPDAKAAKDEIRDDLYHDKGQADEDVEDAVDQLRDIVEDKPEILDVLTDLADDE